LLAADGAITNFFLTAAADSDLFAHQLIWALNSEARPPEEAFNPEVKRCGQGLCSRRLRCSCVLHGHIWQTLGIPTV